MKVLEFNPKNNLNINHRKENYFQYEYSIIVYDEKTKKFSTPVILRVYITGTLVYACVYGINLDFDGSAKEKDYQGTTMTVKRCLESAGFKFEFAVTNIPIEDYMTAIAKFFGYKNYYIHKSNP